MGKEVLTFGDIDIEKDNFYCHRSPTFLKNIDIDEVLVSEKISSVEKTISTLLVTSIMIIK